MTKKEEKNPFKTVSEQLPFYPDLEVDHNEPLICVYEGSQYLGDDPDPEKHIPVYSVVNIQTGEKLFIIQSYAIKKAVEAARKEFGTLVDIVFRFEYLGKKTVNGKPFNLFNTAYCTLKDYNETLKPSK